MKTLEEQQRLSESLLAACRYMLISKPKYISYDADGRMWHYNVKPKLCQHGWAGLGIIITHPPYADDWRDSLLEWVEPQGEPLANVLARHPDHVADVNKMIADEARKLGYRKMIAEYAGRRTEAQVYERAWQDALAWKGGDDD